MKNKMSHSEFMTIFCPPSWFNDFIAGKLDPLQLRLLAAWATLPIDLTYATLEDYEAVLVECTEKAELVSEKWNELGPRNRKKFLQECNNMLDASLNTAGYRLEFDPESNRYMLVPTRLDEIARLVQNLI
jgi:hypothetical protein